MFRGILGYVLFNVFGGGGGVFGIILYVYLEEL